MAGRAKSTQMTVEIKEEDPYKSETGSEKVIQITAVDVAAVDYESVADEGFSLDGGAFPTIQGVPVKEGVSFSTYLEGLGTAAGDSTAATDQAITWLFEAAMQTTGSHTEGSAAAGSPTTTAVECGSATATSHPLTDLLFAGFDIDGKIEWRPCLSGSTDLELKIATSAATDASDTVYGTTTIPFRNDWPTEAVGKSVNLKVLGKTSDENVALSGSVLNFSIPDSEGSEVPQVEWSVFWAEFSDLFSDTAACATYTQSGRQVKAGGEFLSAASGSTAFKKFSVNSNGFDLGRSYTEDMDANDEANNAGWVGEGVPTMTVTIPLSETPPAALNASTWREAKRDAGNSSNYCQVQFNYGQKVAGKSVMLYMPKAFVQEWSRVEVNGLTAQQITFAPVACSDEVHLLLGLG